jgi:hypothetical protein
MIELAATAAVVAALAVARSRRTVAIEHIALTAPRAATTEQAVAAARSLSGLLPPWWRRLLTGTPTVHFDVLASGGVVSHVLHFPSTRRDAVLGGLRAALPGLRIADAPVIPPPPLVARSLGVAGPGLLRVERTEETASNVLAALQPLAAAESAIVQIAVAPQPYRLPIWHPQYSDAATTSRGRRATEPAFAVDVRVGVAAPTARRRAQLLTRILGAFHPASTDARRVRRRWLPSAVVIGTIHRRAAAGHGSRVTADELATLLGLPLGGPRLPGVTLAPNRELPTPVACRGRAWFSVTPRSPDRTARSPSALRRLDEACTSVRRRVPARAP